jgi:hypothetical protein
MQCEPLTARDVDQLARRGITRAEAEWQLQMLGSGDCRTVLDRPGTLGDGIQRVSDEQREPLLALHEQAARDGRWSKFVPASGAASRMFALPDDVAVTRLCENLSQFAFYEDLDVCLREAGLKLSELLQRQEYSSVVALLLHQPGLGYADTAKGLLKFHRYSGTSRTPFEEHLREAAQCLRGAAGCCRVHLTVSESQRALFQTLLARLEPVLDADLDSRLEVDFTLQKPATDTLAVEEDGRLLRTDEGDLVLRPAGHGALLENLNDLQADLLFVKNIDNVCHENRRAPVLLWTRLLGGYLIQLERARQRCAVALEADASPAACRQAEEFLRDCGLADTGGEQRDAGERPRQLRRRLHRPLRVCGVVRNAGEPGGGPFWVREPDGSRSLQIVESAEVDAHDQQQQQLLRQATHFNPVFMALAVRDHHERPFDLHDYVDRNRVIVSRKVTRGRSVRVLERPGLWNGAMAQWGTVFVEVPGEVFSPVKTVFDLLRSAHRP